jgi:hypothetical protein
MEQPLARALHQLYVQGDLTLRRHHHQHRALRQLRLSWGVTLIPSGRIQSNVGKPVMTRDPL